MKNLLIAFLLLLSFSSNTTIAKTKQHNYYSGHTVAKEGAWCWFADPRAINIESNDGSIYKTIIGYIDNHGSIKATQIDWTAGTKEEVLIRSWFQPDDHNNPAFLELPDHRIMILYSRHTDEPCFYYRISKRAWDVTMLGEEKVIKTSFNTTYPNLYILTDDPNHIYMCWRGTNWHPTIARMTMPDKDDNVKFDWGPHQMVQSSGARPYAKYISNGKDKIYLAYTTGHPDNEYPNWLYCNVFDINTQQLTDIKGNVMSTVGVTRVFRNEDYLKKHPYAVVDHQGESRDWLWNIALDKENNPIIGMTRISKDKKSHDYYYAKWNGKEWTKTFIANGGGHFHQTPSKENCYSGGMAVDRNNPQHVYCSVPVNGVYEIMEYTLNENGTEVLGSKAITHDSQNNNARPFVMEGGKESNRLLWMNGDYYYWIVNKQFPLGYPTSVMADFEMPAQKAKKNKKNAFIYNFSKAENEALGKLFTWNGIEFGIDKETLYPYLKIADKTWKGQNKFATADSWATDNNATTDGKWYAPVIPEKCTITLQRDGNIITVYRDGVIDIRFDTEN